MASTLGTPAPHAGTHVWFRWRLGDRLRRCARCGAEELLPAVVVKPRWAAWVVAPTPPPLRRREAIGMRGGRG